MHSFLLIDERERRMWCKVIPQFNIFRIMLNSQFIIIIIIIIHTNIYQNIYIYKERDVQWCWCWYIRIYHMNETTWKKCVYQIYVSIKFIHFYVSITLILFIFFYFFLQFDLLDLEIKRRESLSLYHHLQCLYLNDLYLRSRSDLCIRV